MAGQQAVTQIVELAHRRQLCRNPFLGPTQLLFRSLLSRDVFVDECYFSDLPVAILERINHRREPPTGVILLREVRNRLVRVVLDGWNASGLAVEALVD